MRPVLLRTPIVWMDKAVNNANSEEALTVQDALRMCTYNGCYTTFDDKQRGSLEKGKIADMVILSADPYTIPKEKLGQIKVEKLILQGKEYESCKRPVLGAIWKGLTSGSRDF